MQEVLDELGYSLRGNGVVEAEGKLKSFLSQPYNEMNKVERETIENFDLYYKGKRIENIEFLKVTFRHRGATRVIIDIPSDVASPEKEHYERAAIMLQTKLRHQYSEWSKGFLGSSNSACDLTPKKTGMQVWATTLTFWAGIQDNEPVFVRVCDVEKLVRVFANRAFDDKYRLQTSVNPRDITITVDVIFYNSYSKTPFNNVKSAQVDISVLFGQNWMQGVENFLATKPLENRDYMLNSRVETFQHRLIVKPAQKQTKQFESYIKTRGSVRESFVLDMIRHFMHYFVPYFIYPFVKYTFKGKESILDMLSNVSVRDRYLKEWDATLWYINVMFENDYHFYYNKLAHIRTPAFKPIAKRGYQALQQQRSGYVILPKLQPDGTYAPIGGYGSIPGENPKYKKGAYTPPSHSNPGSSSASTKSESGSGTYQKGELGPLGGGRTSTYDIVPLKGNFVREKLRVLLDDSELQFSSSARV